MSKLQEGKEKFRQYREENRRFRRVIPFPVMLLNDALPLFVVVAYVLLGVLGNWWHPGWILFFLIPIYYLTVECFKHKTAAPFPIVFIVTAVYLCLGFIGGYWHPYWAIYALVPIYYIVLLTIKGGFSKIMDLVVLALTIGGFLAIGFCADAWHPGWVIFFTIPLYYAFKDTLRRYRKQKAAIDKETTYTIDANDIKDDED